MSDRLLTIGELAHQTGLASSALRYYENLGLLQPPRRISGQRRYNPSAVEHVGMILFLREVGFSLAETKALLTSRSAAPNAWRSLAHQKLAELDQQIRRANVARVALQHALRCRHEDVFECPNFAGIVAARLEGKSLEEAHSH
jgi:DNA-binding transcriptional MerR regulator